MKSSVKIAVILPSRGLIFSQTADEILQNLEGVEHRFFFSHRQPLPDCFETPTQAALKDKTITHLWLIEDDMVLPPNTLKDLLAVDKAVVTVNYPTTGKGNAAILTINNQIIYGGTGCLLVKREVFAELKPPYFRSDIVWIPRNYGDYIKFTGKKSTKVGAYGLHDVNFYINLYLLGIPAHKLNYTLGQRKLIALGKAGTNDGAHNIVVWKKVKEDRFFDLKKNLPVQTSGGLVAVLFNDGTERLTSSAHAKKLVEGGLAAMAPRRAVVLDNSELL